MSFLLHLTTLLAALIFSLPSLAQSDGSHLPDRNPDGTDTDLPSFEQLAESSVVETNGDIYYPIAICKIGAAETIEQENSVPQLHPSCPAFKDTDQLTLNNTIDPINLEHICQQQKLIIPLMIAFGVIRILTGVKAIPSLIHSSVTAPAGINHYFMSNSSISEIMLSEPAYHDYYGNMIPMITCAYGSYEALEAAWTGRHLHIFHGLAITASCASAQKSGKLQLLYPAYIMEVSQVFFNAGLLYNHIYNVKGRFPPTLLGVPFVVSFIGTRWVLFGYESYKFVVDTFSNNALVYKKDPDIFQTFSTAGIFFNLANLYWGFQVIFAAKRKVMKILSH